MSISTVIASSFNENSKVGTGSSSVIGGVEAVSCLVW